MQSGAAIYRLRKGHLPRVATEIRSGIWYTSEDKKKKMGRACTELVH